MTDEPSSDGEITTADEFRTALEQLFVAAAQNDVNPRGAWVCRTGGPGPDWEAVICELADKQERNADFTP